MVDKKTGRQIFWTYFVYFLCMLAFCVVRIVSDRNLIAFDNYYEKFAKILNFLTLGFSK